VGERARAVVGTQGGGGYPIHEWLVSTGVADSAALHFWFRRRSRRDLGNGPLFSAVAVVGHVIDSRQSRVGAVLLSG
jgi:hypothetical protein